MCGEMAGDQTFVPLLIGMERMGFSMWRHLFFVRNLMKKPGTAKMEEYIPTRALTECATMEEVLELSKEYVNVD